MVTNIDTDSVTSTATQIDDTDSPYTTTNEDEIQVDTTTAAVTVTLATGDLGAGREIRIVDTGLNAGTNAITIDTEGTETINPGTNSSISINIDGGYEDLWSDGSNWYTSRHRQEFNINKLGSALDANNNNIDNVGALTAGSLSITDRTYISARPSSDIPLDASTWTDITLGNDQKDRRGELDPPTGEFTPDEGGHYEIRGMVNFDGGSDGDNIEARLRNRTDSDNVVGRIGEATVGGTGATRLPIFFSGPLTAGKSYLVQVQNLNSSDNISAPEAVVVVDWIEEAQ